MFPLVTILAAFGCAVVSGAFFAFSAVVMPGLRRVTPAEGVAAMRAVNAAALNPAFLGLLLGTGVLSAVAAVGGGPPAWVGAGLYLVGCLVLTVAFHVPRNDELERVATPGCWARYLREWVPANHVRALASLAAGAAFALATLG